MLEIVEGLHWVRCAQGNKDVLAELSCYVASVERKHR